MIFKRKGFALYMEMIGKFLGSLMFFPRLLFNENFTDYIRKNNKDGVGGDIILLANGPSLKAALRDFSTNLEIFQKVLFGVINEFACADEYEILKPKLYVISDDKYFIDTIYKEKSIITLSEINRKTSWNMSLFIPYKYYKVFVGNGVINNPLIKIIPFHSVRFWGLDSIRMLVYKWGLGNGEFGTVITNAIYVSIVLGFKNIYLYGVDHTFFDGIHVTHDNVLCYRYEHFDDQGEVSIKPMISHHDGVVQPFTMQDFLKEKFDVFTGHVYMRMFAEYMGCKIINCTKNSLVDTYERGDYK